MARNTTCCTWLAHDCARATWAYVLETVHGAIAPLNAIIIIIIIAVILLSLLLLLLLLLLSSSSSSSSSSSLSSPLLSLLRERERERERERWASLMNRKIPFVPLRADYTGSSCNVIQDTCRYSPCDNGGTCVPLSLGYNCQCKGGYPSLV